jgi:phenylpropionate dioxygenase-like ring-hydroxylating dioxygenase large terminal subunit
MNRAQTIALTKRLLDRVTSNSSDDADSMMVESADVFLDPERLQRERSQFFLNTPQVVGFAGELAIPGSYKALEVLDIPIVITRDETGVLRAFINACAHRGAPVAKGCGQQKRMTCQFHGWSYSLDGHLAGRPKADAFDEAGAETRLTPLAVSDNAGLLVVAPSPDISQHTVDHHLDDIAPALAGFHFDQGQAIETRRFEVAANWKLVAGLSHESYHFATLHRDSLAPLMTAHAVVDEFGPHTRWAFPFKAITALADKDPSQWPDHLPGVMNHTLFPGTVLVVPPTDAQLIRVEPGVTPGESVVYYSGICTDPARMESARSAYAFGGDIFETEDLPAAARCQQGLAAGRPSVIFGRNEPVVQAWHRRWNNLLSS